MNMTALRGTKRVSNKRAYTAALIKRVVDYYDADRTRAYEDVGRHYSIPLNTVKGFCHQRLKLNPDCVPIRLEDSSPALAALDTGAYWLRFIG